MILRIKPNRKSGERNRTFTTEYGGVKYSVGPKPSKFPDEVGRYFLKSFSGFVEQVEEPVNKK